MESIKLPKDKDELARAITAMKDASWTMRRRFKMTCRLAHHYLNGIRHFDRAPGHSDLLLVGYENAEGALKFRNEALRTAYRTVLGQFMRMDLRPHVKRVNWGLDAVRGAAIAQVALDYQAALANVDAYKPDFLQQLLTFGMVGVAHWRDIDQETNAYRSELEIVPPWELLPIPERPLTVGAVRGVMRHRYVPLSWLEDKKGSNGKKISLPNSADAEIIEVAYGYDPEDMEDSGAALNMGSASNAISGNDRLQHRFAPLTECWTMHGDRSVAQYVAKVGSEIVMNIKMQPGTTPLPIGIARHTPTTGWYSYGLVGMLMGLNHQGEKMIQNLMENVSQLDAFGTVLWPTTAGVGHEEFNKKTGRPKVVLYEPDYSSQRIGPERFTPVNTGELPGKVASFANEMIDSWAGLGPLYQGQPVGRVDSAAGVGLSFEISQITTAATAAQIADAWANVYKAMLASAKADWGPETVLQLTYIDDNIAGVSMQDDGQVVLESNPLPRYAAVDVDVRERRLQNRDKQVQELLQVFQMGGIDLIDLRIEVYKRGLDFPIGSAADYESHRVAMYNNVRLFNDGKTPGQIYANTVLDDVEVHLRTTLAFTRRLEFKMASPEVRSAFEERVMMLQKMVGQYPSQAPPSFDLAGAAMQQMGPPGPQGG